ncbi:MAG: hypothetical protein WAU88_03525, partial [Candidatus Zixiibacteriota bacterium]
MSEKYEVRSTKITPQTIAILGRQPALGIAELESLYGGDNITPFGAQACIVDVDAKDIDFNRLGGSIRIAKVLATLPSTNGKEIEKYLIETTPEHASYIDGKLSFGISVFGVRVAGRQLAQTALSVKKAIRSAGISVRMVPQKDTELGSATVLYNKLTRGSTSPPSQLTAHQPALSAPSPQSYSYGYSPSVDKTLSTRPEHAHNDRKGSQSPEGNGWELLVVSDGQTAYLAQTVRIQDIDAYAARDQARPHRDAKVGMLPPKLAQIIINLAIGRLNRLQITVYGLQSSSKNTAAKQSTVNSQQST